MARGGICSQNKAHAVGSCRRIQKWCLTAAGPAPTLQPQGMCCVWAALSHQGSYCGEGRGRPSRSWPEPWAFPALRRDLFWLRACHLAPALLRELPCLQKAAHFSYNCSFLRCKCFTPECKVKNGVCRKLCLVERRHPVLPLQMWYMDPFQHLWFLAHVVFLKLLLCVLHRRRREKKF